MTRWQRRLRSAAIAAAMVFATAGGPAAQVKSSALRVLFIGNSYTYFHNLPGIVEGLAAGLKPPRTVEAERVTVGGATLIF